MNTIVATGRGLFWIFISCQLATCRPGNFGVQGALPFTDLTSQLTIVAPDWQALSLRQAASQFEVVPALSGKERRLWQKNDLFLVGERIKPILKTKELLVMVSFAPAFSFNKAYRPLAAELLQDRRTQFYFPGDVKHPGFALLTVGNSDELTTLAASAHGESGLPCGQVEVLDFSQNLLTLDTPTSPSYGETIALTKVKTVIADVSASKIKATVQTLQDLGSRQHNTASGLSASTSIQTLLDTAGTGLTGYSSELRSHGTTTTAQKSVIATISGTADNETTIVIGAHLDSINKSDASQAPGADDDASGIATLVEAVRVINAAKLTFKRKIEFHAYAAEEIGLVGSSEIATAYRAQGRKVAAMLQLDMNAYSKDPANKTIYLITNDTSAVLRQATGDLLETYLGGDFKELTLDAGTSDHRSWNKNGYNGVFPFEHPTEYNHFIHSSGDTVATINNFALSERFTKLVVAFLAHQAGLVESETEYAAALTALFSKSDLAFAVIPSQTANAYTIAVGTTTDILRVEGCLVGGPTETVCLAGRTSFTATSTSAERNFFAGGTVATGIALAAGNYLRVMGWSKDNALLAQRTVLLSAK